MLTQKLQQGIPTRENTDGHSEQRTHYSYVTIFSALQLPPRRAWHQFLFEGRDSFFGTVSLESVHRVGTTSSFSKGEELDSSLKHSLAKILYRYIYFK